MKSGVGGVAPRAGEEIAAALIRRRQKINQDELEFSVLAAQFAQTDEYDWQGADSPISWIKANCHMSGAAACDRICVGEQADRLGQSARAMAAGEIGFAHFALIAHASAAVGDRLDETQFCAKRASTASPAFVMTATTLGMSRTRRVARTKRRRVSTREA